MFLKKGEFMHPYVTVILLTVAAILLLVTWILYENRKQKKRMLRKIQRIYGKVPEREYAAGDLKNISHYFLRKKGDDFWIDDITWNDLDMDRIYMLINQTVSSPGEDVLYDMLRRPVFRQEDIDRREKLIRFFAENKEKREQMQILLSNVGKTWHGSLSDTILALEEAPQVNTGLHWVMFALLIVTLVGVLLLSGTWFSALCAFKYSECGLLLCRKRQTEDRSFSGLLFQLSLHAGIRREDGDSGLARDQ